MTERIAKLTAFVDRAWSFGCSMAGDSAWKGKLFEQGANSVLILANVGVKLAIRTFQICVRDHARPAVTWTCNVDRVQIVLLNNPIEVHIDKIQSWGCAPMPQQPGLDVL